MGLIKSIKKAKKTILIILATIIFCAGAWYIYDYFWGYDPEKSNQRIVELNKENEKLKQSESNLQKIIDAKIQTVEDYKDKLNKNKIYHVEALRNQKKYYENEFKKIKDAKFKSLEECLVNFRGLSNEYSETIIDYNKLFEDYEKMELNRNEALESWKMERRNYLSCNERFENCQEQKELLVKDLKRKSKGNLWRYIKGGVGGALFGLLISLLLAK